MGYIDKAPIDIVLEGVAAWEQYQAVDEHGKTDKGKHWWLVRREFADGRTLYLYPCGGGVSLGVSMTPDDCGYRDVFDYFQRPDEGMRAALCWDGEGEPEGWNRAHRLGHLIRRRNGGGGPETEYIDPHELRDNGYVTDERLVQCPNCDHAFSRSIETTRGWKPGRPVGGRAR